MKQQEKQQKAEAKQDQELVKSAISQQVFSKLGQPDNLQSLQVRHLWNDHFRVNIFVGTDAASSKLAHSFFLNVNSDGNILSSEPVMKKVY